MGAKPITDAGLRFHDLRHSFASQLVSAAVPIPAIQRLLGHADITTTARYAHLAPDGRAHRPKGGNGNLGPGLT